MPHRGSAPGLEAEIVSAHMAGFAVVLRTRGEGDVRLARGLLAPAAAEPCHEGVRDAGLVLDGATQWLRPVSVAGQHTIVLAFPPSSAGDLLAQTPVVDLVLLGEEPSDERCLRLPLSGPSPELSWKRPFDWSASWGARLAYPSHPVASVDHGWSVELGAGRWLGPVRVGIEAGLGLANCSGLCPPAPPGGQGGFVWIPSRAAIEGYVVETPGFGLAAEIDYQLLSAARLSAPGFRPWELNHGPRGAIRFDLTSAPPAGWPGGGRQGAFGLELSVGESFSAFSSDHALLWGIGLVNHVGF